MATKTIGGYEFSGSVDGGDLILRFPLEGKYKDGDAFERNPDLLLASIESAFHYYDGRREREENDRREREGQGVDSYVLRKIVDDVEKVLSKYDQRTLRASAALRGAVMEFNKGDIVRVSERIKNVGDQQGTVVGRRQKYVLVKIGETNYKCPPSVIKKVGKPGSVFKTEAR